MGVSLNGGTPKSSILIGFSIIYINYPFWGTTILGNPNMFKFQWVDIGQRESKPANRFHMEF